MQNEKANEAAVKNWFLAAKYYHDAKFSTPGSFLKSAHAVEFGLDEGDIREFRHAVQSCDAKWQTAVRIFVQDKYTTKRQFLRSGKFLRMGFSPSREHADILTFAIKFYHEEKKYRDNANSPSTATTGRWADKSMFDSIKSPTPSKVVGFDQKIIGTDRLPSLLEVEDDSSDASHSRISGGSSITCSVFGNKSQNQVRLLSKSTNNGDSTHILLVRLEEDRGDRRTADAMMFLVFAVIPLVIGSKIGEIFLAIMTSTSNNLEVKTGERASDIESVWEDLKAITLLPEGEFYV